MLHMLAVLRRACCMAAAADYWDVPDVIPYRNFSE